MEIIMKTFCGDDGNYAEIPLSDILDKMTDDWIDSEVTVANISELRDACRKLLETEHNSDYAKCANEICGYLRSALYVTEQDTAVIEILRKHFA